MIIKLIDLVYIRGTKDINLLTHTNSRKNKKFLRDLMNTDQDNILTSFVLHNIISVKKIIGFIAI